MTHNTSDPNLNLHSFNDHGIFTIEELNELSTIVKPHLSALHLNIRSLSKHFDELCNLLDSTPFEFDLIACSETWITPQVDTEEIQITVKLYTCQLLYDYLIDNKSSNFNFFLVSEQHNYSTRSASLQLLNPSSFRINIRKFCPTVIGCYYWNDIPLSIRNKPTRKLFKKALYHYYFAQY